MQIPSDATREQVRAYECARSRGASHHEAMRAARKGEVHVSYRAGFVYGPTHSCTPECE